MAKSSHIASFTVLVNITVALCTLLWFYNLTQNEGLIAPNIGIWLVLVIAAWLVNLLFLKNPRTIVGIVILNSVFAIIQALILCLLLPKDIQIFSYTLTIAASIVTSAFAAYFAVTPIYSDHLLPLFELSFIVFIFLLWLKEYMGFSSIIPAPVLITLILNILSLILVRICAPSANSNGQSGLKGTTVLIIIFLVILLMVGIFSLFLAAPIGDLALKLVEAVTAAFEQIMAWLNKFLVWFLTLLGWQETEEEPEEPAEDCTPTPDVDYTAAPVEVGFIVIGLMIAALAYLIYKLRKKRFSIKINRPSTLWIRRFFHGFKQTLKNIFISVKYAVQSFVFDILKQNTLQGLFYEIEKYGHAAGMNREKGETPHAYLLRLSENVQKINKANSQEIANELRELSHLTDKYF